jgi:hypothetical protein
LLLVSIEDGHVIEAHDPRCKDGVGFTMAQYEKTNTPFVQHEGELSCQVMVTNATIFVCEGTKTEYICNQFVFIVSNAVAPYAGPGYGWTCLNSGNRGSNSWAVGCRGAA